MAELIVEIAKRDDAVIVSLNGPGDLPGAAKLDSKLLALTAQHPSRVVFDLSGLTFISSIFMGSLIKFRQGIDRAKGKVVICGAPMIVLEALQRARLDQVFSFHPAVDDAVRALCVTVN